MVWWRELPIVGAVVVGAALGVLLAYVVLRIQKRPWPFSKKRKLSLSNILGLELETNLMIATTPWTGKPLPFRTGVWSARSSDLALLNGNLKEELTEAYADISLANRIVWLSTEVGLTSKDLEASYTRLCGIIDRRLRSIIPLLK
jgi:hypothetical protein